MIIEIEKMMFGDYRVNVWDEHLQSALDKEYFCRGYDSAVFTAINIRTLNEDWENLPIYSRNMDTVELVKI